MNKWIEPARGIDVPVRDDVEAQLARVRDRHRARRRRRVLAGSVAGAAVAMAVVVLIATASSGPVDDRSVGSARATVVRVDAIAPGTRPTATAETPVDAAVPVEVSEPAELALGDGSVVTPLAADSKLLARSVGDGEVRVELVRGSARFEVPDRDGRRFVAAIGGSGGAVSGGSGGGLAVETHGGAFRIVIDQRQVVVMAERGRLVVHDHHGPRVVDAGDVMTFVLPEPARVVPAPVAPSPRHTPPPPDWHELSTRGDYATAWTELSRTGAVTDVMVDLMAAGDVARLSGHPAAAVAFLSRALSGHADDPRASLAAFTLGRIHLEDLGAPRDAAQAFARAYALSPDSPLAEDALAREVEAWSRAGETDLAHARAVMYARRYPQGRRIRAVYRFGGLDPP